MKYNHKTIQPDLIVVDSASETVLVIDYKHFIAPITTSEVDYKIKELKKGIKQVSNYIETISALPFVGSVNILSYYVIGIIISDKPLPIPIPLKTDSQTFIQKLLLYPQQSDMTRFLNELTEVNNKPVEMDVKPYHEQLIAKDWTIVRTLYKLS